MWWRMASGCLNLRYQARHEESHISKCQSLLNQDISDLKIKSRNWSYGLKYPNSQPPKSHCQNMNKCCKPHEDEKRWSGNNHLVQAQVEQMYFLFNLEYRYAGLSRGMLRILSTKSHAQQKPNYPSEICETQWPHTPHLTKPGKTGLYRKNWRVQFGQMSSNG
jgi:hypothetical protein